MRSWKESILKSSLTVTLALAMVACGRGDPAHQAGTPPPTETPTPLDARDLHGVHIQGPIVYPDGIRYIAHIDSQTGGRVINSGDITNAVFDAFNPQADPRYRLALGEALPGYSPPGVFETKPNDHGNYDIVEDITYVPLPETIVDWVSSAPPAPSSTPDSQATAIRATVEAKYLRLVAQATGTAMAP